MIFFNTITLVMRTRTGAYVNFFLSYVIFFSINLFNFPYSVTGSCNPDCQTITTGIKPLRLI